MSDIELEVAKAAVVERLKKFPMMNRSMLVTAFISYKKPLLLQAIKDLVEEGTVIEEEYSIYNAKTPLYFLASERERLAPYIDHSLVLTTVRTQQMAGKK